MKTVRTLACLFLFVFVFPSVNVGQDQAKSLKNVESVLMCASNKSKVTLDDTARSQILQQYRNASYETKKAVDSTTPESLNKKLGAYFEIKKLSGIQANLSDKDVADFNWNFVHGSDLVSVRIISPIAARIQKVTSKDLSMSYNIALEANKDMALAIPINGESFSLHASTAKGNLIWTATGVPSSKKITFPSSLSKGCEIYVNSEPDKAIVYFNDKEYHWPTNTSSARDPGKRKVTIKKGSLEWVQERVLEKGETWMINAKLK